VPRLNVELARLPATNRFSVGEPGRDLHECFGDDRGDRIQVAAQRLQAEALRLEKNRPAATEWVQYRGEVFTTRTADLIDGIRQNRRICDGVPGYKALNDPEKPLALGLLSFLGREQLRVSRGIIYQRCKENRPTCCQRLACPPQVECRRVPASYRLLSRGLPIDHLERECHLDELSLAGHEGAPARSK
jgi:hypothetical protein